MTLFGLPTATVAVFAATVVAGCIGALHYVIAHVLLDRPFGESDVDYAGGD